MLKNGYVLQGKWTERWLNFWGVTGMTLWPFILVKHTTSWQTVRHEMIHIRQQREMLVIPFYLWYALEYLMKWFVWGKDAYWHLSHEREAYIHDDDEDYLNTRKPYRWTRYIRKFE